MIQLVRQFIIGYKVEIYTDKIIVYKSYHNKKMIMPIDVQELIGSNDFFKIIYHDNGLKKTLKISTIYKKKTRRLLALFYEKVIENRPEIKEEIKKEDEEFQQMVDQYEKKDSFIIRAPKWQFILVLVMFIVSIFGFLVAYFLFLQNKLDKNSIIPISAICGFFFLFCGLGVYSWFKEKIIYENGVLTYIKIFKRSQSTKIKDIKYIYVNNNGQIMKVYLIDENGKSLINFLDDGSAFKSGELLGILFKNGIKEINEIEYYKLKDKK